MDSERLRTDLEYIIQKRPLPETESMIQVLARLDEVAGEAGLPDRLVHYLSKRSYVKALEWLDNPETPHRA